jgi:hypothetical protein
MKSRLGQANAAKQADLAAVRREVELLQIERDDARDAAHAWNLERAKRSRTASSRCPGRLAQRRAARAAGKPSTAPQRPARLAR